MCCGKRADRLTKETEREVEAPERTESQELREEGGKNIVSGGPHHRGRRPATGFGQRERRASFFLSAHHHREVLQSVYGLP